jgi:hypothetical protein
MNGGDVLRHKRRPTRKSSCRSKDKLTESEAKSRAFALQKKDGAPMSAYKCRFAGCLADGRRAWHVGHKKRY